MDRIVMVQEEPRGPNQLIEVPVTQNGLQRVQFPDVQQLRSTANVKIIVKEVRLITAETLTHGPITGFVAAPVAELQKLSLVIYCEGWEKAQFLPILVLNDMTTQAGAIPHRYHPTKFDNWVNVDWSKTYLQYSNGTQSANSSYVVMLDVVYVKLNGENMEIKGPS